MFKTIEKLRRKSERTRRGVAFGISALVVVVIFGVWASVWSKRFADQSQVAEKPKTRTPVSTLFSSFDTAFAGIGEQFANIKSVLNFGQGGVVEYVSEEDGTTNFNFATTGPTTTTASTTDIQATTSTTSTSKIEAQ